MKELTLDQMESVHGGGCTFASDLAVNTAAAVAGTIIGIASAGLGFFVGLGVSTFSFIRLSCYE